jgi:hypothetical protein
VLCISVENIALAYRIVASDDGMTNELKMIRNKQVTVPEFAWKLKGKLWKTLVSIVIDPARIQTCV